MPSSAPADVPQADWDEFLKYARKAAYSLSNQYRKNGKLSDDALKFFRDLQRKVEAKKPWA